MESCYVLSTIVLALGGTLSLCEAPERLCDSVYVVAGQKWAKFRCLVNHPFKMKAHVLSPRGGLRFGPPFSEQVAKANEKDRGAKRGRGRDRKTMRQT